MFSMIRRAISGRRDTTHFTNYYSTVILSGFDGVPTADEARRDYQTRMCDLARVRIGPFQG